MTDRRDGARSRRPLLWWIVGAVVVVLIAVALWVSVRGLMARDALETAAPLVKHAQQAILDGDSRKAKADLAQIQHEAHSAASLTGDPVWRSVEVVPWLGQNLTAFRQAAEVIDGIADDALPPLADLSDQLNLAAFVPKSGVLDVQPIIAARPQLAKASAAMERAKTSADKINTAGAIPQIGEAVDQLIGMVDDTATLVSGVSDAAKILPGMLGSDGPRQYLLLVQNNAELRASGGIPGALAVIRAEGGKLSLGQQSTAAAFGQRSESLPISNDEKVLFGENLGKYLLDATVTPDFARTGALAEARWSDQYGPVDGVISVDPVALSYLLKATGAIDVGGIRLTSDNVVQTLLSDSYVTFPKPAEQDAFFAAAAARVFNKVTAGGLKPKEMIAALAKAGGERRILVWSNHPDEQAIIAGGSLSGPSITSTSRSTGIGVYFDDNTEAKMDWYLKSSIAVGSVECRNDDRPYYEVRVELRSTAPLDAATSLPSYVTGTRYGLDVDKGQIRTTTYLYAPPGSTIYDARIDGTSTLYIAAKEGKNSVAGLTATLDPGKRSVLSFYVLGPPHSPLAVSLQHTPTAFATPTSVDNILPCPALPTNAPNRADGILAVKTRG
ncbi:MAG: hypothetical protein JWO10_730 [Microbacteriaceae bacterium]|nr:hypothetical protein [Microbacteriaceae bacterium]